MRISELKDAPKWLLRATVENEDVEIVNGRVIWKSGIWIDGIWHYGVWKNGIWRSGLVLISGGCVKTLESPNKIINK